MPLKVNPHVVSGKILGRCPKCAADFAGSFDTESENVTMICGGCNHVGKYFYRWPDELPPMILRHRNNRRLLGVPGPTERQNPDDVLPGQLKLFKPKRSAKT